MGCLKAYTLMNVNFMFRIFYSLGQFLNLILLGNINSIRK